MKNLLFSKALGHLPIAAAADETARLGFDGVDLTTRAGGHVDPARVAQELPEAVAACAQAGVQAGVPVTMLTTDIKHPDDDAAPSIFEAAARSGIKYLKLGYIAYEYGSYQQTLEIMKRDADGFAGLAARHGVCACHHIHSGPYMTLNALTVAQILDGHDPDYLGAYIDPCHMWIEGPETNWLLGLEALRGKVRLVAVKDFVFRFDAARPRETFHGPTFVPLRRGLVAWDRVMRVLLEDHNYDGPLSFHMEYHGLSKAEELAAVRDDLKYLSGVINDIESESPRAS